MQVAEVRRQCSIDDQDNDGFTGSAETTTTSGTNQSSTVTHTYPSKSETSTRPTSLPGTRRTSLHDYAAPVITPLRQGKIDGELAQMITTNFQPLKFLD